MSVYIKPCRGCPLRLGCELREEFRQRVTGLGLRSATFNCQKLSSELRPGRRIVVTTPKQNEPEYLDYDATVRHVEAPATILTATDVEFSCVIDPGHVFGLGDLCDAEPDDPDLNRFRFRKYQRAQRIVRFLDEPDAPICENGRVLRDDKCDRPPALDGGEIACSCAARAET